MPILLGLELEQAEKIVEAYDLFILVVLYLRELPRCTLGRKLCNPPRQILLHRLKGRL
jgi:hypothetical protein